MARQRPKRTFGLRARFRRSGLVGSNSKAAIASCRATASAVFSANRSYGVTMPRSSEDYRHELNALDAAHAQNEAGRDAFVALAHTALFASSVAFVGDVTSLDSAIWRPAVIVGWAASVTGLLTLTISFGMARRTIDKRREALNDDEPPSSGLLEILNGVSLWSFPVALLCLFSFVTANVVNADDRRTDATSSTESIGADREGANSGSASAELYSRGSEPSTSRAQLEPGQTETGDGSGSGPTGTGSTSATATAAPPSGK